MYEKIARSLFRSGSRHMVLTGNKGVGKTSVLREFARRAAIGLYPFLSDKRLIRLDCSAVPPEDGRAVMERIVSEVGPFAPQSFGGVGSVAAVAGAKDLAPDT